MDSTTPDRRFSRLRRAHSFVRLVWVAPMLALSLLAAGPAVFAATAPRVVPTPSFTNTPTNPVVGELVTFTSTSHDPDGEIEDYDWDTDGDGFDDGDNPTTSRTYTSTGNKTVRLRVDYDDGSRTSTRTITVAANGAPTASFDASTTTPDTGQTVTLTSTSSDPEGRPLSQAWDLDNNGSFNDATGGTASVSFPQNGTRQVRLRVRDHLGLEQIAVKDLAVQNRQPVAAFNVSATEVDTGTAITFTSTSTDPDGTIANSARRWDFNGDGITDATGTTVTRSFADNGTPTITHSVTDDDGGVGSASHQVTIRNRVPAAAFGADDSDVDTGTPITFTSSSTDPDGTVASHAWDLDNDGAYDDATGPTATHSFGDNGTPTVRLLVTDDDGGTSSTSRQVTIRNRAPRASFTYAPADPVAGDEVELSSGADDPDGTVANHRWDLDGDGDYDDATGPIVSTVFNDAGTYDVGLEVTDDDGASSTPAVEAIDVAARPASPQEPPAAAPPASFPPSVVTGPKPPKPTLVGPRLLDPFPLVRVRGVTTARGARLDLLSVRTLGGTKIIVRCKGGGCPWARKTATARFGASRLRSMNMPGFKRRHLRAGTVLEVFVIKKGMIGKYTRFKIRRVKAPLRIDRCTAPGVARVRRCPT